jgi:hypothetical protein
MFLIGKRKVVVQVSSLKKGFQSELYNVLTVLSFVYRNGIYCYLNLCHEIVFFFALQYISSFYMHLK